MQSFFKYSDILLFSSCWNSKGPAKNCFTIFANTVLYFLRVFTGTQSSNTPSGMIYLLLMIWSPLKTLIDNFNNKLLQKSWIH